MNDYSSWIKFIFNTAVWSVSDKWFKSLPDDLQEIIVNTARESIHMARGINVQQCLLDWEEGKKHFKDTYMVTPDVKKKWKKKLRPAFYEWVTEDFGIDSDYVDNFLNQAEKISKQVKSDIMNKYGTK